MNTEVSQYNINSSKNYLIKRSFFTSILVNWNNILFGKPDLIEVFKSDPGLLYTYHSLTADVPNINDRVDNFLKLCETDKSNEFFEYFMLEISEYFSKHEENNVLSEDRLKIIDKLILENFQVAVYVFVLYAYYSKSARWVEFEEKAKTINLSENSYYADAIKQIVTAYCIKHNIDQIEIGV